MEMNPGSSSPDKHAAAFLNGALDPLRYDGHTNDPLEVAGVLAALVPANSKVLDVGCGTGSVTQIIAAISGARIIGLEPDPDRAAVARSRGLEIINDYFTAEVVEKLGLFNAIVFADVLEHLPDPTSVLQLATSLLKPGGCVVLSVPNVAHWSVRISVMRGRFDPAPYGIMDATHLRWFTRSSLLRWLAATGMTVDEVRPTAGKTLPDYSCRRPWRYLLPRMRNPLIHKCLRLWPELFACQWVVRARPSLR
jgi:2-polyprenyl-3-methyl-5-hydroxy-6-metoxy-1,4-benzoquinol methylase